jgi:hypothetical protein
VAISAQQVVPHMLLMPAFQISNPVKAFIQMIIYDLVRHTCLHLRVYILPIFILRPFLSQEWNRFSGRQ